MNNFLRLQSSWGLSDKPGYEEMIIDEDGSYTIKIYLRNIAEKKDEHKSQSGKINPTKMKKVINFLNKNVTKNTSTFMFDASYLIEYTKGRNTFKIENDYCLWEKLIALVPEYTKFINKYFK